MFIGFVKFEIKQWFSAYQDQFCVWFSLARLPTETARVFFPSHFLKKKRLDLSSSCFSYLLNALTRLFCTYLLSSHVKYYLKSESSKALAVLLTNLINHCIAANAWPSLWKCSNVTPLFKKHSRTDKTNYRPVSVLTS